MFSWVFSRLENGVLTVFSCVLVCAVCAATCSVAVARIELPGTTNETMSWQLRRPLSCVAHGRLCDEYQAAAD